MLLGKSSVESLDLACEILGSAGSETFDVIDVGVATVVDSQLLLLLDDVETVLAPNGVELAVASKKTYDSKMVLNITLWIVQKMESYWSFWLWRRVCSGSGACGTVRARSRDRILP